MNFKAMSDNELMNAAAEYGRMCETLERAGRNYGKAYFEYAEHYNDAIAECERRNLNTKGL